MRHENSGKCEKCLAIINRYPGFNKDLLEWFVSFQSEHPEAHTSCAGRGPDDQEELFHRGATRAHWGQSAHNYNVALDIFAIIKGEASIYPRKWFNEVLAPNLPEWVDWYGEPGSSFRELPHIEVRGWRVMVKQNMLSLVGQG